MSAMFDTNVASSSVVIDAPVGEVAEANVELTRSITGDSKD